MATYTEDSNEGTLSTTTEVVIVEGPRVVMQDTIRRTVSKLTIRNRSASSITVTLELWLDEPDTETGVQAWTMTPAYVIPAGEVLVLDHVRLRPGQHLRAYLAADIDDPDEYAFWFASWSDYTP